MAEMTKQHIPKEIFQVESPLKRLAKKFLKKKTAVISLVFILLLLVIAVVRPTPYDISEVNYTNTLSPPNSENWFGTDEYGRDVFSRIIHGTRLSLSVALAGVTIGGLIGTFLGIIAGYYRGFMEKVIMRVCDVMLSFPGLLLAIGIVAIIGPGLINVVIAIAVYGIPNFTRIIRSSTLAIKELLYIEASRSIGVSDSRLLFKHILPGTIPAFIVSYTMRLGTAIISAASLSFLGFGASSRNPDWGAMLSSGRDYIGLAPHMLFYPGMAIFLTVLAFNMVGDGLRDTLDPKLD